MQALLLGTETIQEFLAELAGLVIRAVGEGLSCGITLQPNGRPVTVASTDALAAQVDEVQYGLDEGPFLHALRTGTQVSIENLASDRRWVAYQGNSPRCRRPKVATAVYYGCALLRALLRLVCITAGLARSA